MRLWVFSSQQPLPPLSSPMAEFKSRIHESHFKWCVSLFACVCDQGVRKDKEFVINKPAKRKRCLFLGGCGSISHVTSWQLIKTRDKSLNSCCDCRWQISADWERGKLVWCAHAEILYPAGLPWVFSHWSGHAAAERHVTVWLHEGGKVR